MINDALTVKFVDRNHGDYRIVINVESEDDLIHLRVDVDAIAFIEMFPTQFKNWNQAESSLEFLENNVDGIDCESVLFALLNKLGMRNPNRVRGVQQAIESLKSSRGLETLIPLEKDEDEEVFANPCSVEKYIGSGTTHVFMDCDRMVEFYLYQDKLYKTSLFGDAEKGLYFYDHEGNRIDESMLN